MLSNSIIEKFLAKMPYSPTNIQHFALEQCSEYLLEDNPYAVFLLKGYAGTGKTFLLQAITSAVEEMGLKVELMASTGRAAKHLAQQTGRVATTIHRRIYRAKDSHALDGTYQLTTRAKEPTLFIVDEASMISGQSHEPTPFGSGDLLEDLLAYVWESEQCKLIMVGDLAQLPPVGQELSDALNSQVLAERYGLQVYEAELDEIVRQGSESNILTQATYLRELLSKTKDYELGEAVDLKFKIEKGTDVSLVSGVDLIDCIDSAYRNYGRENCLVVSPSNKRALTFNQGIRAQVFDYEERIVRGENLIVARNNYYYAKRRDKSDFIANGEALEVVRIHHHIHKYDLDFADATIYLPDRDKELEVRLLLTSLDDEKAQRSYNDRKKLYDTLRAEYGETLSGRRLKQAIAKDPYWGALEVKYAYAVTAHKAQGGQWACVFIDFGLVGTYLPIDKQMLRWLYTAVTRATQKLYLINVPQKLLDESD